MNDWLERLLAWDQDLFVQVNAWLHGLVRSEREVGTALRAANEFGTGWAVVLVLIGIVAVEVSFPRALRRVAEMGLSTLAAGLLAHALKHGLDRPRPPEALEAAFRDGAAASAFGQRFLDGSWPSGHTASAFALVAVFWWWATTIPGPWRRWVVRLAVLAIASLTGLARIYAGVHYPLDVLGGALLGAATGLVVVALSRRVLGPWTRAREVSPRRQA